MTDRRNKLKKAALAAVAYYLEQEAAEQQDQIVNTSNWAGMGKDIIMKNRAMVQRRGRMLRNKM